ncbi:MAG: CocE/NonD family hydrolase [Thermomicrobiales bacterium]
MSVVRPATVQVLNDVPVPMRDGVSLSADVYLPFGMSGSLPVILSRTPYDNNVIMDQGYWWAQQGYVYVAQDVRGRYDSGGEWVPWENETEDGYDTLEWIGQQPWCDGNIGMSGASYGGQVQWQAGYTGHPLLKAIVPRVMGNNLWDSPHYQGGAFGLGVNAVWGWRTMARTMQRIDRMDWPAVLQTLPLRDMDKVSGKRHPAFSAWLDHEEYGEYWHAPAVDEHFSEYTVPILQVCGWFDLYAGGMMANFVGLREKAGSELSRQNQFMIMGPWTHPQAGNAPPGTTNAGDRDFGIHSLLDTRAIELAWFDRWLKGKPNDVEKASPLKIFVMGAAYWRNEQEWPLARTVWTPYYLRSGGNANTLHGDGWLSTAPAEAETPDEYDYDPLNPCPTNGGCNCCNPEVIPWGVYDQRPIEMRPDVLVFTTPPLEHDLEVTGPVTVTLYASTDGPDTDFTAKLVDVYPDGKAWNLCDGIIRARYRKGRAPSALLTPGEVYEFVIDLWVTSNVFKKGHAIRVEISSSNFPRFDRNLNTGNPIADDASPRIAHQTVYHDADYPSHILLPVIPD